MATTEEDLALRGMLVVLQERAQDDDVAYAALKRYEAGGISLGELAAGLVLLLLPERERLKSVALGVLERRALPIIVLKP